jgi:ABC-type hemin transport system substrate-binding protein
MRKLVIGIVFLTLVMSATAVLSASVPKAMLKVGPNYMGFSESSKTVKVGSTFTMTIYVDVHSAINAVAVDKLTFLPAGIIYYKSVVMGNVFGDNTIVSLKPWVIDNAKGSVGPTFLLAGMPPVNNVKKTLAVITFTAMKVGTVTLTMATGATAGNGIDPGTTKYTGIVNVVK